MVTVPERYRRTDRQRQTDRRLTVASPRSALASRGKNTELQLINCVQMQQGACAGLSSMFSNRVIRQKTELSVLRKSEFVNNHAEPMCIR